jgi:hypothetical protein
MPTLRFGKLWQVIRHFGVLFFCNFGTPKTVISNFVPTTNIVTPYLSHVNMVTPTMFPWDKKCRDKKVSYIFVLIPWYPISYLTIAGYGFFWGRLRVPSRRCDLVVPADWGWGRSNETERPSLATCTWYLPSCIVPLTQYTRRRGHRIRRRSNGK